MTEAAPIRDPLFWSKVLIGDGCWEWQASTARGYGQVTRRSIKAAPIRAHRHAIGYYGPLVVMHACDNPLCVRPSHLSVGTVAANNQDCAAKGRTKNQHA